MKVFFSLVCIAVGVSCGALECSQATAAPILDQSHVLSQSVGGLITVSDFTPGQTFTVGQSGMLSQLDVAIRREASALDDIELELWPAVSGLPTGLSPLFSTTIANSDIPAVPNTTGVPFTSVDVSDWNLPVESGEEYAIAVRRPGSGFGSPTISWGWGNPGYAGGNPISTAFGRPWESEGDVYDFAFQTWVDLPPAPQQPHGPSYRLVETARALPPADPFYSGLSVSASNYYGTNFEITSPTLIREVGGQFISGAPGQVFAALVELDSINGAPSPTDFSGNDVLKTALLDLPASGAGPVDISANLDIELQPGFYGLWLGSGKFGATGNSSLSVENDPVGSSHTWSLQQPSGNRGFFNSQLRMFVDAASAPGTVQLRPTTDAEAEKVDGAFELAANEEFPIDIWNSVTQNIDRRALLEFDISAIPPEATITSVVLDIQVIGRQGGGSSTPRMFVHGYAGDGEVEAADAEVALNLIGTSPSIDDLDTFSVALDSAYVQSLLGQASHLGLMGIGDPNGLSMDIRSLEGNGLDRSSFLTISYTLDGDFDADLDVDGDDFLAWQRGDNAAAALADWQSNLGAGSGSSQNSLASGTIPEPSTAFALLVAAITQQLGRASRYRTTC